MTLRPLDAIRATGQPLARGEMSRLPVGDESVDVVFGVRTPFQGGDWALNVAKEACRVLVPGGQVQLHSSNLGGGGWLPYLEEAGFGQLGQKGGFACGVKEHHRNRSLSSRAAGRASRAQLLATSDVCSGPGLP
ncbi:MAG: hypothetical protein LC799_01155 [Actinobacteria bacterium]|nr:hypothetical protein [Actinomycetota bacterium]